VTTTSLRPWAYLATLIVCVTCAIILCLRLALYGPTFGTATAISGVFTVLLALVYPPRRGERRYRVSRRKHTPKTADYHTN
jgi:hypothetical protein